MAAGQVQNYIKTITQRDSANTATQQVNVTYFDGLGRPTQKIQGKMGADGKDIITHIEYDGFGRQLKEYLPYVSTNGTTQAFDTNAYNNTMAYYSDNLKVDEPTSNPYSQKFVEASPLARLLKQAAPGNAWVADTVPYSTNDRTVKFVQMANSINDLVKKYSASTDANYVPTLTNPGSNYVTGELYKTITKDENWKSTDINNNTVQEFKNREGQLILKRTFNGNVAYNTYYVYDQFGNLTYVLPPLVSGTITTTTLNNLCYQYKYDGRNRLIEKKLPGKQWEFIVYDLLDRPILTGPALSPWGGTTQGWIRTIYDDYGRVAMTGWYFATVNSTTRASAATTVVNAVRGSGTNGGISTGYNPIPSQPTGFALLTINYYDDYAWPGAPTFPVAVNGKNARSKVKGLTTGSWVRVLDAQPNTTGELSYTLYDYKWRQVRSRTANYLGGFTQIDTTLDFDGSPTKTVTTHKRTTGSTPDITVEENLTYTAQGRLRGHTHKIDALAAQELVGYTYNKLGQLKSKSHGSLFLGALQNINFKYNARGWLTDINDIDNLGTDLFAFKIAYNTVSGDSFEGVVGLYNGNISETYWKTATDDQKRKYSYKYDNLNRLKHAYYQKPGNIYVGSYDEDINYDPNGNITSLSRNGAVDDIATAVQIDDLTYIYATGTNRLMKVYENDANASPQGFKDSEDNLVDDYIYDNNTVNGNGNVTADRNKGITNIKYNHLNLPVEINFGSTNKIIYLYDAAGRKLKKTVTEVVSGNLTTVYVDYLSGFQYKGGVMQFFPTAEGYVDNTVVSGVNKYNYVYQYKDHLGNVRLSYTKNTKTGNKVIMEENHYYPFGLKHLHYNRDMVWYQNLDDELILYPPLNNDKLLNNYNYNGKELQDELGLNMYDYGARNYDPTLGRWMNMDPLAETSRRWSPYNYCYNNPVVFVDPDGMEAASTATPLEMTDELMADWDGTPTGGKQDSTFRRMHNNIGGHHDGRSRNVSGNGGDKPNIFKKAWSWFKKQVNGPEYQDICGEIELTSFNDVAINQSLQGGISCNPLNKGAGIFTKNHYINWGYFRDRLSGYVQDDGAMRGDFTGGSIGKNGVIYNTIQAPWTPGINLFGTSLSRNTEDFILFTDLMSTQFDITSELRDNDKEMQMKTFYYYKAVPIKVPRMDTYGLPINGTKDVKMKGYIFINGQDTTVIKE